MPYLSDEDREKHAERSRRECPECHCTVENAYCSKCDEFYPVGHKADCSRHEQHTHV